MYIYYVACVHVARYIYLSPTCWGGARLVSMYVCGALVYVRVVYSPVQVIRGMAPLEGIRGMAPVECTTENRNVSNLMVQMCSRGGPSHRGVQYSSSMAYHLRPSSCLVKSNPLCLLPLPPSLSGGSVQCAPLSTSLLDLAVRCVQVLDLRTTRFQMMPPSTSVRRRMMNHLKR